LYWNDIAKILQKDCNNRVARYGNTPNHPHPQLSRKATAESVCNQIHSSDKLQKGHSVAVMLKG
jgi:hypothetical protein